MSINPTVADLPERLHKAYDVLTSGTAQILPENGLVERLLAADREDRRLRVKLGIDPSGAELTLGHAVVLRKLRQFQDLGHLAVLIVGDVTGQVGDPTGRSVTRKMLTAEQTAAHSAQYFEQVMKILRPDRVEVRRNFEWLGSMTMVDVLRHAKVLTVAQLLERDDFARRFRTNQPISLVELLYPMLQGMDSVAVHADIEIGGTDQTYNILVGRVMQRAEGLVEQAVLTVPVLEGLDGVEKMSKSLNNYVSIVEPPSEQFGKIMSIPDSLIERYARLCTDLQADDLDHITMQANAGGPQANTAKRQVAREIVALYHGEEAAHEAEERFIAVFRHGQVPVDVPSFELDSTDVVHLPALLVQVGFAKTTSESRRLIDQGAVRLDGERIAVGTYDAPRRDLAGHLLSAGKRRQVRLRD